MHASSLIALLGASATVFAAPPPACQTPPGFFVQNFEFTTATNPGAWSFTAVVEDTAPQVKCNSTLFYQDFVDCTHDRLSDNEYIKAYIQEVKFDAEHVVWYLHLDYHVNNTPNITYDYYGDTQVYAATNTHTRPVIQKEQFEVKINQVKGLIINGNQ